jgi:hypothetical protein
MNAEIEMSYFFFVSVVQFRLYRYLIDMKESKRKCVKYFLIIEEICLSRY